MCASLRRVRPDLIAEGITTMDVRITAPPLAVVRPDLIAEGITTAELARCS